MKATVAAMVLSASAVTALGACTTMDAAAPMVADAGASIAAAVADALRPAADTARDAARKPLETVRFAGVKPGDVVAELAPGGGYFTRVLARTVGPAGRVYALVSPAQAARPGGLDAINALAAQYGNITVLPVDYTKMVLPAPVDVVWTTENWHDFNNGATANPAGIMSSAFAALKPGGFFYIQDHAGAPGTGTTVTSTLHRIDPQAVIAQGTAGGFTLDAQSNHLANPADNRSAVVRDSSVAGNTDKFALRFRKPR